MGCALGVAACNSFHAVRYVRLPEMLDDLCTQKNEERPKRKKSYIKCDLLIIDDWLLDNAKANEAREILEVIEGSALAGNHDSYGWLHALRNGGSIRYGIDASITRNTHWHGTWRGCL